MHTPNLQLSNIATRQQHYVPQRNSPNFNFQLEPITHKTQKRDISTQKMQLRNRDLKQRKQSLQKSERMRRQVLLQKIAQKNCRFQSRQKAQKQNKNISQITSNNPNKSNLEQFQKFTDVQKHRQKKCQTRFDQKDVKKIYVYNQKQLSSTKGFNLSRNEDEIIRSILSQQNANRTFEAQQFKDIKIKHVKLPQLNSGISKPNKETIDLKKNQKQQIKIPIHLKEPKVSSEQLINPILKTHDTRYFGIEQNQEDFQKIGKNMLKLIKRKYWCYDSLESEEIYQNFENLINDEFD